MRDVLIPKALLRDPHRFGGTSDGDCLRGDLVIRDGQVKELRPAPPTRSPRMVITGLAEPHCHLDKCHTIARLGPVGGDLEHALDAQRADKVHWTAEDIQDRASQGLSEARAAGCSVLRSHVDWGDDATPPLAWGVLSDLASSAQGCELQLCPLIGIDQWADAEFAREAARAVARTGHVIGAFIRGHARTEEGLKRVFDQATRHGLMLDFHVDEGLGDLNGLEAIADTALATGFEGPILCGHAVSLMDRSADAFARIADKLVRAGIAICALPTTNFYLQGRNGGTPDRRGITRLQELRNAGVTVLVGSDNVGDAFCPMGQHDPMAALHLAALGAHLDPPMGDWLPMITTDARAAMGVEPVFIDGARPCELLETPVRNTADLVARRAPLRKLTE